MCNFSYVLIIKSSFILGSRFLIQQMKAKIITFLLNIETPSSVTLGDIDGLIDVTKKFRHA